MQRLSHSTRAYFINAGLLKGFLVPLTFQRILNLATEEEVQALGKHQHIDMRTVIEKLESIEGKEEKLKFLQLRYPSLSIFVMEKTGMDAALSDYTQKCRGYESDAINFSLYIHGYLIPTQKKMRE